jgi:hypothetical protein
VEWSQKFTPAVNLIRREKKKIVGNDVATGTVSSIEPKSKPIKFGTDATDCDNGTYGYRIQICYYRLITFFLPKKNSSFGFCNLYASLESTIILFYLKLSNLKWYYDLYIINEQPALKYLMLSRIHTQINQWSYCPFKMCFKMLTETYQRRYEKLH